MGKLKQGSNPYSGATESEEKHLRLRGKQLTCGRVNGMRIRQSLQPYVPRKEKLVSGKAQWLGAGV